MCEIHCHGSQAVIDGILAQLEKQVGFGCGNSRRIYQACFLNGKMDLSGVEGTC